MGSSPTRGSFFTALGVLCCFALFVCLTVLASFFLPSHLSFKNMYLHVCISEVILTPFPQHAFHFEKLKSSVIRTHLFLEKLLVKVSYMYMYTCSYSCTCNSTIHFFISHKPTLLSMQTNGIYMYIHNYIHIHMYMYMYICNIHNNIHIYAIYVIIVCNIYTCIVSVGG